MTGNTSIATQQHRAIEKASKVKNPLEPFINEYSKFTSAEAPEIQQLSLYCKWKADMDSKTIKWAFKLAERNVGPFYKTSVIGWQPKVKQADLNKNWARYLVAYNPVNKQTVAYSMFRFDMDYGHSVLYCYEMQIEKEFQRKGLGRFMMSALEKMAKYYGMEKIILTVLTNNDNGIEFFKNLGYAIDDTTPEKSENAGYEILSKSML